MSSVARAHATHELVDQVELVEEANVLAHWLISWFAKSGHRTCFAAKSTIARWLREDRGIRGARRRAGQRGLATSTVRRTLTAQSILNRLRALEAAGIVEIVGGGVAKGKRYAGLRARGIKQHVRLAPKYWDALRGAWKPSRAVLERAEKLEPARCGIQGCERVPCIPQLHAESEYTEAEARIFEVPERHDSEEWMRSAPPTVFPPPIRDD